MADPKATEPKVEPKAEPIAAEFIEEPNPEIYLDLVKLFQNNKLFMEEYKKFLSRHVKSLDLLREDWQTVLKESPQYAKWARNFPYNETSKQYFTQVSFLPIYQINVITAGMFHFCRRSKQSTSETEESVRRKVECFDSGPIVELSKAFAQKVGKSNRYNYMRLFTTRCSPVCSQCKSYSRIGDNCVKTVSFFDGKDVLVMSSNRLQNEITKRYYGVADITVTGAVFFNKNKGQFTDVKLVGNVNEVVLASPSSITPDTDNGQMRKMLKSQEEELIENNVENISVCDIRVEKRHIPVASSSFSMKADTIEAVANEPPSKMLKW